MQRGGRQRPIRLFYFRERDGRDNLGDALSPLLVEALSGRDVRFSNAQSADLVAIGSILDGIQRRRWQRPFLRPFEKLAVWGTGTIRPGPNAPSPNLICHAVRGKFTAERLMLPAPVPLGDPGLLVRSVYPSRGTKRYRWVIIPHLVDRQHPAVQTMVAQTKSAKVIDVTGDAEENLDIIRSADFVVSTSLHGVVLANAYDKPFVWGKLYGTVAGGRWKFDDYFSAFDLANVEQIDLATADDLTKLEPRAIQVDPARVQNVCNDLQRAFDASGFK